MRKIYQWLLLAAIAFTTTASAQTTTSVTGSVEDNTGNPIANATVSLLSAKDSALVKAGITDKAGVFTIPLSREGNFYLQYSVIGFEKRQSAVFTVAAGETKTVEKIQLTPASSNLQGVTVTSKKPMIEVKADKTVFNVESSINATGSNALELLQKSPGVQVDNNENISMKGKTGVKIYVDGKMMQLDSKDLAAYLKSINSNDIEAIEMISNPSAKYDASGNAGIINIRLKKNKKYGTNGSVNAGLTQGVTPKGNGSVNLNYRDKKINVFGNVGGYMGNNRNRLDLYRAQNDSIFDQHSLQTSYNKSFNVKAGIDYFLNRNSTIGGLVTYNGSSGDWGSSSLTDIYYKPTMTFVRLLQAFNTISGKRTNANYNFNYRYEDTTGKTIAFDADYGAFRGTGRSYQPNNYYGSPNQFLYQIVNRNFTPTNIDIYTAKVDFEQKLGKGKIGYGGKTSFVSTKNTFDFFNDLNGVPVKQLAKSNKFSYDENVNAVYGNYNRELSKKFSLQAGVRVEQTNSKGVLTRADGVVQADNTVSRHYLDVFPSGALTYTVDKKNTLNLTFSRRIDRPTYQDLNPFENKLDELTYEKGNAFLKPQYTNNVELSHTFLSMITTTLSYAHVKDFSTQITDTTNNNATYIQQRNLATQNIIGASIGSTLPINKWWNGYVNLYFSYQHYKGSFGKNEIDVTIPGYGAYLQQSFILGKGYTGEVSGWYSGPSVWGGTWKTSNQGGLDAGLQKSLMKSKATAKITVTDIFLTNPWTAHSDYAGVVIDGKGSWESRTVRLSFTYRFGSAQIKAAKQHQTGLETEAKRIK
jgi:iron complex outermembrane recepter protein